MHISSQKAKPSAVDASDGNRKDLRLPGLLLIARSPFLFGYAKPVPVYLGSSSTSHWYGACCGSGNRLAVVAALAFPLVVYLPSIAAQWAALNLKNQDERDQELVEPLIRTKRCLGFD